MIFLLPTTILSYFLPGDGSRDENKMEEEKSREGGEKGIYSEQTNDGEVAPYSRLSGMFIRLQHTASSAPLPRASYLSKRGSRAVDLAPGFR